jgi:hypothetical protein
MATDVFKASVAHPVVGFDENHIGFLVPLVPAPMMPFGTRLSCPSPHSQNLRTGVAVSSPADAGVSAVSADPLTMLGIR